MKELIPEEQLYFWVPAVCLALTVLGPLLVWVFRRSLRETREKTLTLRYAIFTGVTGLVLLAYWKVYNGLEDFYGLDSVKALGINLVIALALGMGLRFFFNRICPVADPSPPPRTSKARPAAPSSPRTARRRKV